jgi:hypothetical protein
MEGGLILSQVLTRFTTPVIYLYSDWMVRWMSRVRGPLWSICRAGVRLTLPFRLPQVFANRAPAGQRSWLSRRRLCIASGSGELTLALHRRPDKA